MKKILIIEDNDELRENLYEILLLDNYEVITANNGKVGIQLAHEHIPDLILCDVMMPELDGFGVLKILNRTPSLAHIPLIFLTAKGEKEDFRKGMGLGAEDYISKPFDDVELLSSIEMRLQKTELFEKAVNEKQLTNQQFFSEAKADEELKKISTDKEKRRYSAKDIIYKKGQKPRWLYFIEEGQIKVSVTNDFGKELTTQLMGAGNFLGYFPLINDNTYQNNASCLQDTLVRLIPKDDFLSLLFNNRDFAAKFIKLIANQTMQIEAKLIDHAYSSVRKKVALALLQYVKSIISPSDQDIEVILTREELASLAGTTKETAIRTLSDFKAENIIEIKGKSIILKDLEALSEIEY